MWAIPPASLAVPVEGIHLWWVNLATAPVQWANLSAEECARASRYHHPRDQQRFVAGRAALRQIVARYVGQPPATLTFHYGLHGKPHLPGWGVHFNVAHAATGWLAALTGAGPLGVDVVALAPLPNLEDVVAHGLTPQQARRVQAAPPTARLRLFWRHWLANEARLKADGRGLGGAGVVAVPGWRVRHFTPAPGYWAALAVPQATPWPVQARWQGP